MKKIQEIIDNLVKYDDLSKKSREEMLETLNIYHEELVFQNDELRLVNQSLQELQKEYEKIFMEAPIAYLILDSELKIQKANISAFELFEDRNLKDKLLEQFITRDNQDNYYFYKQNLLKSARTQTIEIFLLINDKKKKVRIYGNTIQGVKAGTIRIALVDITKESQYLERIEYLSYHDQLTGLKNRRYLDKMFKEFDNQDHYPLLIVMCDVNGLKLINDKLGHQQGDKMLVKVAHSLEEVFGDLGFVARQGGDEFVVLISKANGINIDDKISSVQKKLQKSTNAFSTSVAVGYAYKENVNQQIFEVFRNAEDDMYKNKRAQSLLS